MSLLRLLFLLLGASLVMGASKVPSGQDGYREGYVYDGKQNYPVKLYGIAIDWDRDCKQKNKAETCERLGLALEEGLGDLNIDPRGAVGYWLLACEKGVASGCARAARYIDAGMEHYPANAQLAMETALEGCVLDNYSSCSITALHLYRGDTTYGTDRTRAMDMWNIACGDTHEESCRMKAGALYHDSGDATSQAQAVELYRAGCDRKQGWGCSGLANAYATGVGIRTNTQEAFAIGQKGCLEAEGDTVLACAVYARYLGQSLQPENVEKAGSLLTKACLARIAQACNDAGRLGKRNPTGVKIADWEVPLAFRDGCDLGFGPACGNLGQLYVDGFGKVAVDRVRAVALFDKACGLGDSASCTRLENLGASVASLRAARPAIDPAAPSTDQLAQVDSFAKSGRGPEAIDALARLMEESVAEAEWMFGGWLYYGYPGVVDYVDTQSGFILFENAARQGHLEALKFVSMAYWEGDGVAVDQQKATNYMGYVAERGDPAAEAIYRSMLYEPVRQENARRQAEMAAAASDTRANFWASVNASVDSWIASTRSSSSSYSSSWQSTGSIIEQSNWNNYINYMSGGTTACPASNPYC